MSGQNALRVRRSLTDLQEAYERGEQAELEALWRAWKGIKELPPDDPNSFFMIGGYHGEPFRGAGWGNASLLGRLLQPRQRPVPDLASHVPDAARGGAAQHSGLCQRDDALLGRDQRGVARGRHPVGADAEGLRARRRDHPQPAAVVRPQPGHRRSSQPRKTPTTASPWATRPCAIRCPAWSAPKTRSRRPRRTTPSTPTTTRT